MDNVYKTIYKYGEDQIIINKSRFIGYAMPIKSEEEALDFIGKIKTKHRMLLIMYMPMFVVQTAIYKDLAMMENHRYCRHTCFRSNKRKIFGM